MKMSRMLRGRSDEMKSAFTSLHNNRMALAFD